MQIEFVRSGGFIGIPLAATIDTDTLPDTEVQELRELIDNTRFFELPPTLEAPMSSTDQFEYRVTVQTNEQAHTVILSDAAANDEMQRLLRRLTVLARSAR